MCGGLPEIVEPMSGAPTVELSFCSDDEPAASAAHPPPPKKQKTRAGKDHRRCFCHVFGACFIPGPGS